jgi:hypothetical protein
MPQNQNAHRKRRDNKAKRYLRKWPRRTRELWGLPDTRGFWLRAQPIDGAKTAPCLKTPGANIFRNHPDGMWIFLDPDKGFADVVCFEDCSTRQNLYEKRSTYMPSNHSIVLVCEKDWLEEEIQVKKFAGPRWRAAGTFGNKDSPSPTLDDQLVLPVRFLRVVYSLPTELYRRWRKNKIPAGYEFFCKSNSLGSYWSNPMQEFLRRMSLPSHFYTKK